MLNILCARLKHYVNQELSDVQAEFRKGRGTRQQIANILASCSTLLHHRESKGIPEKYLPLVTDGAKAFDYVDHNKLWKALKEMGIPDHLICLLRNLYAGQEATVRNGHGTTNWFQTEKGL